MNVLIIITQKCIELWHSCYHQSGLLVVTGSVCSIALEARQLFAGGVPLSCAKMLVSEGRPTLWVWQQLTSGAAQPTYFVG